MATNRKEFILSLYDLRGELLDTANEAAVNERPFYLQKELDAVNEQIRLIENITPEAQAEYFRTGATVGITPAERKARDDEWNRRLNNRPVGWNFNAWAREVERRRMEQA